MRLNSFFKLLNRKINMYDKLATNPFTDSKRLIVVWVEEIEDNNLNSCIIDNYNSSSDTDYTDVSEFLLVAGIFSFS